MKKTTYSIVALLVASWFVLVFLVIKGVSAFSLLTNKITTLTTQQTGSQQVLFDLQPLLELNTLATKLSKNKLATFFLKKDQKELMAHWLQFAPDIDTILHELVQGEQRWLFVFQNSNELRATGGFMGSYAIVEILDGNITSITVEDIYDADGQFTGYFEAPAGISEYLSSGKGLRLPDANWHPDTAKSAEQILPFFALGNKRNIKGIIFVNLEFAQKLLSFLGPIELTDYNTIVTQDNLDEVLRSRRDNFFPGSMQKKHMLSQLLTQVRLKILSLDPHLIIQIITLVGKEIEQKNLQLYSNNQTIDAIFQRYSLRQIIQKPEDSDYLFLVESNVGINKANKNISRTVTIDKDNTYRNILISFTNNNQKPTVSKLTELTELNNTFTASNEAQHNNHLAYINYQRVLVPQNWKLISIKNNEKIIEKVNETIISVNNISFKEIGFLSITPEETESSYEITFTTDDNFQQIYIQKQPGLPATNYILEYNQQQESYTVTNNQLLKYP